jgi:hypothetical protein
MQRINKLKPDSPVANLKKIGLAVLETFQAKSDRLDDFTWCHATQPTRLKGGYRWKMWAGFKPITQAFDQFKTLCAFHFSSMATGKISSINRHQYHKKSLHQTVMSAKIPQPPPFLSKASQCTGSYSYTCCFIWFGCSTRPSTLRENTEILNV